MALSAEATETILSSAEVREIKNRMRTCYIVMADELGTFYLRKRKIAKAFRWWLREKGYTYTSSFLLRQQ